MSLFGQKSAVIYIERALRLEANLKKGSVAIVSNIEIRAGYSMTPPKKNNTCKCEHDKKSKELGLLDELHKEMDRLGNMFEAVLTDLANETKKPEPAKPEAVKKPVWEKKPNEGKRELPKDLEGKHPALIIHSSIDKNEEDFVTVRKSVHAKDSDETMVLLMFALAKEMAKTFGTGTLKEVHEYMTYLMAIPLRKVTDEVKWMVG